MLTKFSVQKRRQPVFPRRAREVPGEEGQRHRGLGRGHRRALPVPRHRSCSGMNCRYKVR